MNLYPRTFLSLILAANVLVTLPLVAAIGYTLFKLEALSERSATALRQASLVGKLGWELPERLNQMERVLRQYEVLHDPSLLDDYAALRQEWRRLGNQFNQTPLLANVGGGSLATMLAAEDAAYARVGRKGEGLQELKDEVVRLHSEVRPLLDEANGIVDAEQRAFLDQMEALRRQLVAAQLLALALTLLGMWYGRRTMARLWSRFERAVLALGEGRLERRIRIRGPEDMERVGRRLEWLRRRMVALEEQRTLVLRHVSHELKTPLAALREGASLLAEGMAGTLNASQAKIAGIMQSNTLRLQTLIDGLLKLQQAGYAGNRIEPVPVRLDELIQQNLTTHQLATRDKRLRVSGTLAPLTVEGGREELMTVVNNLISNAIKFSPADGTIRVMLEKKDDNAVLEVADEGPGIPQADRERIFEPFFRGKATREVAGAGLGLAIAREFAGLHRGRIEVMDVPAGACFRATLPLTWAKVEA